MSVLWACRSRRSIQEWVRFYQKNKTTDIFHVTEVKAYILFFQIVLPGYPGHILISARPQISNEKIDFIKEVTDSAKERNSYSNGVLLNFYFYVVSVDRDDARSWI